MTPETIQLRKGQYAFDMENKRVRVKADVGAKVLTEAGEMLVVRANNGMVYAFEKSQLEAPPPVPAEATPRPKAKPRRPRKTKPPARVPLVQIDSRVIDAVVIGAIVYAFVVAAVYTWRLLLP